MRQNLEFKSNDLISRSKGYQVVVLNLNINLWFPHSLKFYFSAIKRGNNFSLECMQLIVHNGTSWTEGENEKISFKYLQFIFLYTLCCGMDNSLTFKMASWGKEVI